MNTSPVDTLKAELARVMALLNVTTNGDYLSRLANGQSIATQCCEFLREHGPALDAAIAALSGGEAWEAAGIAAAIKHGRLVGHEVFYTTPRAVGDGMVPPPADSLPLIATGPYVDRIIRLFRDHPHDDATVQVLTDFGNASIRAFLEKA